MNNEALNVYLLQLKPGNTSRHVSASLTHALITGVPHGWVHPPLERERDVLAGHPWDLFVALPCSGAESLDEGLPAAVRQLCDDVFCVTVRLPATQYEALRTKQGSAPRPSDRTPPLPQEWQQDRIPRSAVVEDRPGIGPGTLRLDRTKALFLSSALPEKVADKPVSLFNLFKYKHGDRRTHDDYMEGFKKKFGDAAGATVQFMGPVTGREGKAVEGGWDDANLVQYDRLWHYAYMLSTDVYQELNKQKVAGLEDTCILIASEAELLDKR